MVEAQSELLLPAGAALAIALAFSSSSRYIASGGRERGKGEGKRSLILRDIIQASQMLWVINSDRYVTLISRILDNLQWLLGTPAC